MLEIVLKVFFWEKEKFSVLAFLESLFLLKKHAPESKNQNQPQVIRTLNIEQNDLKKSKTRLFGFENRATKEFVENRIFYP